MYRSPTAPGSFFQKKEIAQVALVGIVRLFRDMVRQNIVPMDSRVKMCRALKDFVELRGPVVKVKLNNDNLVTAAVNEMFDSFIERENCDLSQLQQGKEDPILEPERARLVDMLLHDLSPYSKMLHLPVVQRLKRAQDAHEKQEAGAVYLTGGVRCRLVKLWRARSRLYRRLR